MDKRMVDFIRALRAAGVRISLAESQDAMRGTEIMGVVDRGSFRSTLKTTLVKESRDQALFDYFFPLFFSNDAPPLENVPDNLTPDEQQMLRNAMQSLAGFMEALKQLLQQMLDGQPFDGDQLNQMSDRSGVNQANEMYQRRWYERRMQNASGLNEIQQLINELLDQLAQMGMSQQTRDEIREMLEANAEGLQQQLSNFVGSSLAENMAQQELPDKPDLLDVPFNRLDEKDIEQVRDEIRRLAARLRSRASLRHKRAKSGSPDPRRTMRANMKYGGTPLEIRHHTRQVKPSLVLICDVSTSVRYCAEFLLTLIYELQDQVARTNSYIFIGDLVDISMVFQEFEPRQAVAKVMQDNPPGYYSTDLGNSLATLRRDFFGHITSKTTVIILGDGRNNYNNPRLDIAEEIQRKCRRLIWFCPETQSQWGTGDSDMIEYARYSHGVFYVNTLHDLANAVDKILADG